MLTFFLLILCVNIDALSYGIAYGLKKEKFSIGYILLTTLLSSLLFAVPLYYSRYIYKYFDETSCHIINAIILILLGIYYLIPKKHRKSRKRTIFLNKNYIKLGITFKKSRINYEACYMLHSNYSQNNLLKKHKNSMVARFFCECIAISVDAIFTAFLSGFSANFYIFAVLFYAFSNFFAIFLGNIIFYKINKQFKINLEVLSGLIFIILGIIKLWGF